MSDTGIASFSVVDYIVFVLMLAGSLSIGIYYGIMGNKTTEEYLLAGRSMSPIPVALSLIATFISSISILGYVGEVYGHGIQLIWCLVGSIIGISLATFVFMPIIYPLKLSSINEYLELRYRSPLVKRCALVQTSLSTMLYLGLCLYAPTLALESVTPVSSGTYILILGTVVTIYSAFGGLKAVVWTDAFQTCIIIIGIVVTMVTAMVKAGGFGEVWSIATAHGRTSAFNTQFGLHERHTIFNTMLLNISSYTYIYSFSQTTLQRVVTMPDYKKVKLVLGITCFGLVTLISMLFLTGLSIFAVYANCDPISLGHIERKDQMLPFYVMDNLGFMMGIPGVFVACLFSGTMSSISSALNAIPCMLWNDFFNHIPFFNKSTERIKTLTNKLVTVALGIAMIGLAFLSSRLGGLIQATATLLSIVGGPNTGLFLLGVCVPIVGKKGALAGLFSSMAFMAWLGIGSQIHAVNTPMLPLSTSACLNTTILPSQSMVDAITTTIKPHPLAGFYGVSYTLLSTTGIVVCVSVAIVVSLVTGIENLEEVDPALILPCFRKYVGKNIKKGQQAEVTSFIDSSKSTVIEHKNVV